MEMQSKIEETVLEILNSASSSSELSEWTVSKIWETTSKKLNLEPTWKGLVREIVQSYIDQQSARPPQPQKEYDDDHVVCRLSKTKKVTICDLKGQRLLSIREHYKNKVNGKEGPTSKGISLTATQWATLRDNIPSIDKAIQEMAARRSRIG